MDPSNQLMLSRPPSHKYTTFDGKKFNISTIAKFQDFNNLKFRSSLRNFEIFYHSTEVIVNFIVWLHEWHKFTSKLNWYKFCFFYHTKFSSSRNHIFILIFSLKFYIISSQYESHFFYHRKFSWKKLKLGWIWKLHPNNFLLST